MRLSYWGERVMNYSEWLRIKNISVIWSCFLSWDRPHTWPGTMLYKLISKLRMSLIGYKYTSTMYVRTYVLWSHLTDVRCILKSPHAHNRERKKERCIKNQSKSNPINMTHWLWNDLNLKRKKTKKESATSGLKLCPPPPSPSPRNL